MRVKLVDRSRRLDILKFEYSSIYTVTLILNSVAANTPSAMALESLLPLYPALYPHTSWGVFESS
jgi:hypothetical protein